MNDRGPQLASTHVAEQARRAVVLSELAHQGLVPLAKVEMLVDRRGLDEVGPPTWSRARPRPRPVCPAPFLTSPEGAARHDSMHHSLRSGSTTSTGWLIAVQSGSSSRTAAAYQPPGLNGGSFTTFPPLVGCKRKGESGPFVWITPSCRKMIDVSLPSHPPVWSHTACPRTIVRRTVMLSRETLKTGGPQLSLDLPVASA